MMAPDIIHYIRCGQPIVIKGKVDLKNVEPLIKMTGKIGKFRDGYAMCLGVSVDRERGEEYVSVTMQPLAKVYQDGFDFEAALAGLTVEAE